MNTKTLQLMRALLTAVGLMWLAVSVFAADNANVTAPTEADTFFSLYRDYTNASYVVEWPVSAGGVNAVRSRLGRYAYLAFYTSPQQLQNTPLPLVSLGFFTTRAEAEKFVVDNP